MLKTLMQHHLGRALRGEIKNAITNCHVPGLHSVMLHDESGNRIRMFYVDTQHQLRDPTVYTHDPLPLAIHAHHCDMRFVGLFGDARNHTYHVLRNNHGNMLEYEYLSGITDGVSSLTPTGLRATVVPIAKHKMLTNPVMTARDYHTVSAPPYHNAAWLVIEGKEDPEYNKVCYTNQTKFDSSNLYKPMTQERLVSVLQNTINQMD